MTRKYKGGFRMNSSDKFAQTKIMPSTSVFFFIMDSLGILLLQTYFSMANHCDNQVPISDHIAYPTELRVSIVKWKPPVVRITWKHEQQQFSSSPPGNSTITTTTRIALKRFELSYRPTDDEYRSVLNLPREARLVSLDRLRPGTEYELYISAVSNKGLRNDTAPIYFTAPEYNTEINKTTSLGPRSIGGGDRSDKPTQASTVGLVTVREEEIVIVAIVLAFWVAVILVFFNKWGKIRMLEPYQPQYRDGMEDVAPYSPSGGPKARVSVSDPIGTGTVQVHVFDRDPSRYSPTPSYGLNRARQNSVFIGNAYGSKAYVMQDSGALPRKFKSEENLKSLVVQITNCDEDEDPTPGETSPL